MANNVNFMKRRELDEKMFNEFVGFIDDHYDEISKDFEEYEGRGKNAWVLAQEFLYSSYNFDSHPISHSYLFQEDCHIKNELVKKKIAEITAISAPARNLGKDGGALGFGH